MNLKNLTIFIDVAFCVVLLPAMVMLLPLDRWMEANSSFVVLLIAWLYIIYIGNRSVTIPMLFGGRRERIMALFAICVTLYFTYRLTDFHLEPFGEEVGRRPMHLPLPFGEGGSSMRPAMKTHLQQQAVWFLYVMVSAFSGAVALLTKLSRQIAHNQAIEFEKKRAELALYKAQINPHFLFNTLNTLYGLIITKSDKAEEAFVQFTSLMKYIYSNGSADKIAVEAEITYIEQYIELLKLRINPSTKIDFRYDGAGTKLMIAPMLLITFVENVFKYGVSPEVASLIEIHIGVEGDELTLETRNPLVAIVRAEAESGIGIDNCRQRLELLYPNNYSLQIKEDGAEYSLTLKIKLL